MSQSIQVVTSQGIAPFIESIAELRIRVFREWPYLYAGDINYEQKYLKHFQTSTDSVFVLAMEGCGKVIGCATGLPLRDAHEEFQRPFVAIGHDIERIFYFGESVLDSAWRGRGIGHAFFDYREAHARRTDHDISTFCAVVRSGDHHLQPRDYRPLDGFWRKRSYAPIKELTTHFSWQELGADKESEKPMQFWLRQL